jgi:phosphate transport system permease protein
MDSVEGSMPGSTAVLKRDVEQPDPTFKFHHPRSHRIAELIIRLLAGTAIVSMILIFLFIGKETLPLFFSEEVRSEVTLRLMWFAKVWPGYDEAVHVWQPVSEVPKYAMWPLMVGTLKVTAVSMAIAVPLGVGSALWVAEFAPRRLREIVKPVIELLAGVPSVVLGFFALIVLATWMQDTFGVESRLSALLAGAALSIAIIPVIFTVSEEAFRAVPRTYVEASAALGARRYQTVLRIVVPSASPGIAAAVALGLGRAVGETMIVLMASGNAAILSFSLNDSTRTLSATIAAELAEVVFGSGHYTVLFFIGTVLFMITFVINLLGAMAISRMRVKLGGRA